MIVIEERENGTVRVVTYPDEPSLTDQQFKDDTDVNIILQKYMRNGTPIPPLVGQYLDVTELPDFREAQEIVLRGEAAFMSLDAHVRARFQNNPAMMLDFLDNPDNYDEAVKLGLIDKDMATRSATINATNANNDGTGGTNVPGSGPGQ